MITQDPTDSSLNHLTDTPTTNPFLSPTKHGTDQPRSNPTVRPTQNPSLTSSRRTEEGLTLQISVIIMTVVAMLLFIVFMTFLCWVLIRKKACLFDTHGFDEGMLRKETSHAYVRSHFGYPNQLQTELRKESGKISQANEQRPVVHSHHLNPS